MTRKFKLVGESRAPVESAKEQIRPNILYVEDEDVNWRVAQKRLSDRYVMTRSANSRETVECLRKTEFAAILMDIQLCDSDLNGIEITKLLCGDATIKRPAYWTDLDLKRVPPIIFVTAYSSRYSKTELLAAGGADVIPKPVDLIELHLSIARCIAKQISARR